MRRGAQTQAADSAAVPPWRERVLTERRQKADETRRELERLSPRETKAVGAGAPRATAEELLALSVSLNQRMHALQEGGTASWFKLFKHMDDSGSGQVSYSDLAAMVRGELRLSPQELPERRLKAAWLALDHGGSGQITMGEFGAFLRLGEVVRRPPSAWKLHRQAAERARAEFDLDHLARVRGDQQPVYLGLSLSPSPSPSMNPPLQVRDELQRVYYATRDQDAKVSTLRWGALEQAVLQVEGRLAAGYELAEKELLLLSRTRRLEVASTQRACHTTREEANELPRLQESFSPQPRDLVVQQAVSRVMGRLAAGYDLGQKELLLLSRAQSLEAASTHESSSSSSSFCLSSQETVAASRICARRPVSAAADSRAPSPSRAPVAPPPHAARGLSPSPRILRAAELGPTGVEPRQPQHLAAFGAGDSGCQVAHCNACDFSSCMSNREAPAASLTRNQHAARQLAPEEGYDLLLRYSLRASYVRG